MLKKPFENASKSDRLNIELAKKNQVVVAAPSENIPMDTIAEFTLLENCAPRMAKCYL